MSVAPARWFILAGLLTVFAALGLVGGGPAGATPASAAPAAAAPAKASGGDASIRSAHFAPDTAGVDVYLTSFSGSTTKLWHADETYGTVTAYSAVAPGLYVVSVRRAGAAASTPAMLTWNLKAVAGEAYTTAAIGTGSAVKAVVLNDNLTPPAAGHGRVRLIQAASNAAQVDVVAVSGPTLADNAVYGTSTGYAQVMAGTWPLEARSVGSNPINATGSVSVPAGSVTSIVLLNGPGKTLTFRTVLDAAAAPKAPTGPVDAGGGGMAPNAPAASTAGGAGRDARWGGLGAVAVLAGVGVGWQRRRTLSPA